ncbi:cysteine desulfurase NifS [Dictyoglomus thermophilum]|uniref:Cysteine desulfurase IscS n=1 Tax=Dictyoglomus thermophilum (strain ATCC 35947 / DSM 3960 / H-6-12) TaxID=309799 RepID=B5YD31_DICT6|nr:cysteine desulfurase NifS [Dictyoglomus thermophilum]ACI19232.1 aminotransferase, class V superfamily [Dictyoglomus thermophilum H-6-12]
MKRKVYLDYAATTPIRKEVYEEMKLFLKEKFGNPSSIHNFGREVKKAIEEAREKIAKAIGAESDEIIFTSGGTESNNMAIKGVAFALSHKGRHIITSQIEHHAVLEPCHFLEKIGFEITYLPVDKEGYVDPDDLKKAIRKDTILISIMHANNEIGTIEPIREISNIAKEHDIYFHTDAVQTVGHIPVNVNDLGVDLLSLSAHKFYGPKGIGALYIRKGTRIEPIIHGGSQENNKRAGTENVAGIIGMGKALELAISEMEREQKRLTELRDYFINQVEKRIPEVYLNGPRVNRLPNNINFSFAQIEGETLLLHLDLEGIAVSTGSACSSKSLEPSHVLSAIKLPAKLAQGSIRFTIGLYTQKEDLDYTIKVLENTIEKLRSISPDRQEWRMSRTE